MHKIPITFYLIFLLSTINNVVRSSKEENIYTKSYENYIIMRVIPSSMEKINLLNNIYFNFSNVYFLRAPSKVGQFVDVMLPKEKYITFLKILSLYETKYIIKTKNVQQLIDDEKHKINSLNHNNIYLSKKINKNKNKFNIKQYHSYEEIYDWSYEITTKYNNICSIENIGQTYENRSMIVIKIASNTNQKNKKNKKAIWIDGGIHAREWISPATILYIIYELISKYDSNQEIKELVDKYNWYFIPVINPDGYEYSRNTDRFWRKNRNGCKTLNNKKKHPKMNKKGYHQGDCCGTDLNRNWNWAWGTTGISKNRCSDIYLGFYPFSEQETANVKKFMEITMLNLHFYLSLHSYSQILLLPWSHDKSKYLDDERDLRIVAKKAVNALKIKYGTNYRKK